MLYPLLWTFSRFHFIYVRCSTVFSGAQCSASVWQSDYFKNEQKSSRECNAMNNWRPIWLLADDGSNELTILCLGWRMEEESKWWSKRTVGFRRTEADVVTFIGSEWKINEHSMKTHEHIHYYLSEWISDAFVSNRRQILRKTEQSTFLMNFWMHTWFHRLPYIWISVDPVQMWQ